MRVTCFYLATLAVLGYAKPCGRGSSSSLIGESSTLTSSTATYSALITSTSTSADSCLNALEAHGELAVTSCQQALWTLTVVTSTVTERPKTTATEEVRATITITSSITDTVTTETSLYTLTDTATTVVTEPITITSTPILTETQTVIQRTTTTVFTYYVPNSVRAVEAQATPVIPDYATAECLAWSAYASACGQLSVTASTTTQTSTVTETASATDTIIETSTAIALTVTSDLVQTATATTSETQVVAETDTITTTDTIMTTAATSTTTVTTTVLSTATATNTCGAANTSFRLRSVYSPEVPDTLWLYVPGQDDTRPPLLAPLGDPLPASPRKIASWTIPGPGTDRGATGALQLAEVLDGDDEVYVAYYSVSVGGDAPAASTPVFMGTRSVVDAAVAAGAARRISGCISMLFGSFYVYDVDGRTNLLKCGQHLFLSSGDGSDTRQTCTRINLNIDTR